VQEWVRQAVAYVSNMNDSTRLLVITPVRNEANHIQRVAAAMAAQTRRPDAWVVVDDGSTDGTDRLLASLEREYSFLTVVSKPRSKGEGPVKDRLAMAAAPKAFNHGLERVGAEGFTHVAKLDGDTELPPKYFELLLSWFESNPRLGLAGGIRKEVTRDGWRFERPPAEYHVPGALKCYTVDCLRAIGGMHERLGWDTIDEVYARMHGYETRSFSDLVAVHHRPWGSADGSLRGRSRHGRCAYIVRFPLPWVLARAPIAAQGAGSRVLSSLFYVGGYLMAALRRTPRVEDPEYAAFMREEIRARALRVIRPRGIAGRLGHASARPVTSQPPR
jgi:poly-beta-1,6-N-acetyl-D-glucosamine synthase